MLSGKTSTIEGSYYLQEKDQILGRIICSSDSPRIESSGNIFYDLVSCMMDQQIHYRSKKVYLHKLLKLLGTEDLSASLIQQLNPSEFFSHKISKLKYQALKSLANHWDASSLDRVNWNELPDEAVKTKLLPIKGIGQWTVDMILLYTLQRPDIFNPDDLQLKKIMQLFYGLSEHKDERKKQMIAIAEKWKPYRSIAVLYLLSYRA